MPLGRVEIAELQERETEVLVRTVPLRSQLQGELEFGYRLVVALHLQQRDAA